LSREDAGKIAEMDRTEKVTLAYEVRDGELHSRDVDWDVPRWSAERVAGFVKATTTEVDGGGAFFGALDEGCLVGFAVLAHKFLTSDADAIELAILHVSSPYRRHGVATRLLVEAADLARERGAKRLYISATPSESAVGFYFKEGCRLAPRVDEELLALEPEDVHLVLDL